MSGVCLAGFVDNQVDKVGLKVEKALDDSADKLSAKVSTALEKGLTWIIDKILAIIFFIVEIAAVIGIGWILSFMCDKDSRKMVRILVILCVISLVVDKLVFIKSMVL